MIWKTLEGYSKYTISENADIKNINSNKLVKGSIQEYRQVKLYPDDETQKAKYLRVHIIIAKLFCENPNNYNIVNHKDGNKLNNIASNLEWTTTKENSRQSVIMGTTKPVNKRQVKRICPTTNEITIYESITDAFNDNKDKLKYDTYIISVCSGKQKTAGGYGWEYLVKNTISDEPSDGKIIKDYENYMITKNGEVYNIKRKVYLNPSTNNAGYKVIDLHSETYDENNTYEYSRERNAKRKKFRVHQLVATYFIDNPENKKEVNHKDKNRENNNVENLEWVTTAENLQHAHNKSIIQYDINGIFIEQHKSSVSASEKTGINVKNISCGLRKNIKSGGYVWKYANETV